jgi:hypothetical protein
MTVTDATVFAREERETNVFLMGIALCRKVASHTAYAIPVTPAQIVRNSVRAGQRMFALEMVSVLMMAHAYATQVGLGQNAQNDVQVQNLHHVQILVFVKMAHVPVLLDLLVAIALLNATEVHTTRVFTMELVKAMEPASVIQVFVGETARVSVLEVPAVSATKEVSVMINVAATVGSGTGERIVLSIVLVVFLAIWTGVLFFYTFALAMASATPRPCANATRAGLEKLVRLDRSTGLG